MTTTSCTLLRSDSLNAPYGARCFLTSLPGYACSRGLGRLNAPYGARCFLTGGRERARFRECRGLNAPYGARCFLTPNKICGQEGYRVLMHLMALGAF